jgi:hypothetical protein
MKQQTSEDIGIIRSALDAAIRESTLGSSWRVYHKAIEALDRISNELETVE